MIPGRCYNASSMRNGIGKAINTAIKKPKGIFVFFQRHYPKG
jgi:hypothetical protein